LSRDESILLDILRAARPAIEFKGQAEKDEFLADLKTQSAVLHQLLVVGEAVKRLSPEFRAAYPEVPWRLIAATRDKLIHFYEGFDLEEVWKMVTADLPQPIQRSEPPVPRGRQGRAGVAGCPELKRRRTQGAGLDSPPSGSGVAGCGI
jgi:uncharacterized protein with HEPN domain